MVAAHAGACEEVVGQLPPTDHPGAGLGAQAGAAARVMPVWGAGGDRGGAR